MPHPKKLLIFKFSALSLLALMSILLYMLYRLGGSWEFALETRAVKLAALLLTAIAVAVSTLLFQTLTKNRILTPSIMGLDSLYMLLQTALVYFLGSSTQFLASKNINFLVTLLLMMVFSFLLYYILFGRLSHSIFTLLLFGIILGTLFQSGASFMQMLIDPDDFLIIQGKMFASFNAVNADVLMIATLFTLVALLYVAAIFKNLDVLQLGKDQTINLGISYNGMARHILIIVSILVSTSTALVGPVSFLGLLVVNLSYQYFTTHRHNTLLPGTILIAIIALVLGQFIVEKLLTFSTTLSVIINFIGGIYFIYLLVKKGRK